MMEYSSDEEQLQWRSFIRITIHWYYLKFRNYKSKTGPQICVKCRAKALQSCTAQFHGNPAK